jgi:hypothetical protein
MLIIRHAQMDTLGGAMREWSIGLFVEYVEERFPVKVKALGPTEAWNTVRRAIVRAESYGMQSVEEIRGFLDLWFQFGPEFDTRQDAEGAFDALEDPDLAADVRLSLIAARLETAAANRTPKSID